MHREERKIEEHKGRDEVHFAPELVHHSAEHLRKPKVDPGKDTKETASKQNVVDVRNNEVGVVNKEIHGCRSHVNAAETANDEHGDKRRRKTHGRLEPQ